MAVQKSNSSQVKRLLLVSTTIAVVVLIGIWWTNVYESPSNVFWGMLDNNLATSGATLNVRDYGNGASVSEYIQFEVGSKNLVQSTVALNEGNTLVKTQTIGTPNTDYTRYTSLGSKSTTKFKNIIGVWAHSPAGVKGQPVDALSHLFGQTILGVIPYANLPPNERYTLLSDATKNHVYTPDLSNVKHVTVGGKQAYLYTVLIAPRAFATFMQSVTRDVGLGSSVEFNPSNYQPNNHPLTIQVSIDPISRQLLAINYGNDHTETTSGYGIQPTITPPKSSIPTVELQNRLDAVE
jgi:hypothetical protein